jgi:uncharacterized lipoprotein NlpE involved in copper resistance
LQLVLALGVGCTSPRAHGHRPATRAYSIVAPVTYAGTLPCADCPGIQLTVELFPDSTFRLRRVYQDRPAVFNSSGRWSVEKNGTRMVLRDDDGEPRFFQIAGTDSLRVLDTHGQVIRSPFNDWLVRSPRME